MNNCSGVNVKPQHTQTHMCIHSCTHTGVERYPQFHKSSISSNTFLSFPPPQRAVPGHTHCIRPADTQCLRVISWCESWMLVPLVLALSSNSLLMSSSFFQCLSYRCTHVHHFSFFIFLYRHSTFMDTFWVPDTMLDARVTKVKKIHSLASRNSHSIGRNSNNTIREAFTFICGTCKMLS